MPRRSRRPRRVPGTFKLVAGADNLMDAGSDPRRRSASRRHLPPEHRRAARDGFGRAARHRPLLRDDHVQGARRWLDLNVPRRSCAAVCELSHRPGALRAVWSTPDRRARATGTSTPAPSTRRVHPALRRRRPVPRQHPPRAAGEILATAPVMATMRKLRAPKGACRRANRRRSATAAAGWPTTSPATSSRPTRSAGTTRSGSSDAGERAHPVSAIRVPIEELIPQRPPMLLLSRLLSCTMTEGTAEALVAPGNLFRLADDTIHPAAFIELMAQGYAAVPIWTTSRGLPGIGYLAESPRRRAAWPGRDRLLVSSSGLRWLPFVRAAPDRPDGRPRKELTLFIAREEAPGVPPGRAVGRAHAAHAAGRSRGAGAAGARRRGIETTCRGVQEERLRCSRTPDVARLIGYRRRPPALGVDGPGRPASSRGRRGDAGTG
jgi:hypothetical protein